MRTFELRSATRLARLWHSQGKTTVAYNLLAPVCHWFTDGFDTADLKEVKALSEALGVSDRPSGRSPTSGRSGQ